MTIIRFLNYFCLFRTLKTGFVFHFVGNSSENLSLWHVWYTCIGLTLFRNESCGFRNFIVETKVQCINWKTKLHLTHHVRHIKGTHPYERTKYCFIESKYTLNDILIKKKIRKNAIKSSNAWTSMFKLIRDIIPKLVKRHSSIHNNDIN